MSRSIMDLLGLYLLQLLLFGKFIISFLSAELVQMDAALRREAAELPAVCVCVRVSLLRLHHHSFIFGNTSRRILQVSFFKLFFSTFAEYFCRFLKFVSA